MMLRRGVFVVAGALGLAGAAVGDQAREAGTSGAPERAEAADESPAPERVSRCRHRSPALSEAISLILEGSYEASRQALRELSTESPDRCDRERALFWIAVSYADANQLKPAVVAYREFVDKHPSSELVAEVLYEIALLCRLTEDAPCEKAALRQLLADHPSQRNAPDAAYILATLHLVDGEHQLTLDALRHLERPDPGRAREPEPDLAREHVLQLKLHALRALGRKKEANEVEDELLRMHDHEFPVPFRPGEPGDFLIPGVEAPDTRS